MKNEKITKKNKQKKTIQIEFIFSDIPSETGFFKLRSSINIANFEH